MTGSGQLTPNDQLFVLELGKLFVTSLAIVVIGGTIIGAIAFWRAGQGTAKTFSLLIQRGNLLKLLTVLCIVVAATMLAVLGKIQPEGITAILSGIAGYVLGGVGKSLSGGEAKSSNSKQATSKSKVGH